jgi:hypothetical protein
MRALLGVVAVAGLSFAVVGCGPPKLFDGPTVNAFTGRVTQNGAAVTFPGEEKMMLKLVNESNGKSIGIPLQSDGSFKIGEMGIGKYSVILTSEPTGKTFRPKMYPVPGGLTIEEGKTEYTVELGKDWKP